MSQRIAIFVDVQNMFYSAKNMYNAKIDYKALLEHLTRGRTLIRSIAFIIQRPDVSQDRFIEALTRIGYEVKIKEVKNRVDSDGRSVPVKGSYEMLLAIAAIEISEKVDTIVLVTGEGAYVPLVQYLKTHGCKVEIASFDNSTSGVLIDAADQYVPIKKEWTFDIKHEEVVEEEPPQEDDAQPIVAGQPSLIKT